MIKKTRLINTSFIKVLGIVVGLFLFSLALVKNEVFCSQAVAQCETTQTTVSASSEIAPQYYTFSQEKLENSMVESKTVVLYFHAPWCTSCSSFDKELKTQHSLLPTSVVVLKIDFDSSTELKAKYNVIYQHTLVLLDHEGNTKEIWIGGNLDALIDYLKKYQ